MNKSAKSIRLTRNNRSLLHIRLNETLKKYNSDKGEVDIFIHAAKNMYFDMACLQTEKGRIFCRAPINKASWHGFSDKREKNVKLPVINFKDDNKKVCCVRHKGMVQQKNIFLFPICSVYFYSNMNISFLPLIKRNDKSCRIYLDTRSNVRADFFILPRGISSKQFMENFSISFFVFYDITVFNKNLNGALLPLPISSEKEVIFRSFKIDEWTTLIRLVYAKKTREPELCGKYSLLFHDPNDAIEMLLYRRIIYPDKANICKKLTMKEKYKTEFDEWETNK